MRVIFVLAVACALPSLTELPSFVQHQAKKVFEIQKEMDELKKSLNVELEQAKKINCRRKALWWR